MEFPPIPTDHYSDFWDGSKPPARQWTLEDPALTAKRERLGKEMQANHENEDQQIPVAIQVGRTR